MNINKTLTCSAVFSLLSDEQKLLLLLPDNMQSFGFKTIFNVSTAEGGEIVHGEPQRAEV